LVLEELLFSAAGGFQELLFSAAGGFQELLFSAAGGFQEYFVTKPRPSLPPVLAFVELLVDAEVDVLSKFGGILVPTISL
jgi:hypothetical protein